MKLYCVFRQLFDDYHHYYFDVVERIFSSKELAEKYILENNNRIKHSNFETDKMHIKILILDKGV